MSGRTCIDCGCSFVRSGPTKRCIDCANTRSAALERARLAEIKAGTRHVQKRQAGAPADCKLIAHKLVARAISYGFMLPANSYSCADCGEPAMVYDHRDYNKPLDVVPVCTACNNRRGPGIPRAFPLQKTA